MRAFQRRSVGIMGAACAVAFGISACGSSHSAKTAQGRTTTAAPATQTKVAAAVPPPSPRLRIVFPRSGARVATTLTIHVSVRGVAATGASALKYVLDGSLTRLGSARLTYRALAPGDHHVLVSLAGRPSVKARVKFTVPAPAAAAPAIPAATPTSSAPPPPTPATAPAPPPSTTPAPSPAPTPPASGGIPQGANAGDADGDNHGAPSDGDGNI
jgi:hypothetical protein